MNTQEFDISLEQGHLRSKKLLMKKKVEYATEGDRLIQFYKTATMQNCSPQQALIGMAIKHFSSICDMASIPQDYSISQWREKITDLRNYTHLLDALNEEML